VGLPFVATRTSAQAQGMCMAQMEGDVVEIVLCLLPERTASVFCFAKFLTGLHQPCLLN
jgi:hypothetical protein